MAKESKSIKKKAREEAQADFNFSDAFDLAEKASRLTAVEVSEKVDLNTVIHSGSLLMDLAIYGGGLQAGRVYDIHGPESGGKTTLGNIALVQAIRSIPGAKDKTRAYYIDAEGTLDRKWFLNIAKSYGVDLSIREIFGEKDENGNWIHKPVVRLLKPTVGDVALKTIVRILNSMPDKVFIRDTWMYSWTPVETKVAAKTGGLPVKKMEKMLTERHIKWDKDLYNKTGSFMVPVPDNYGGPELVILIDSMIALTPRQTAEDDSAAMAQHGRMFSKYINNIKSLAASKGVTMININQLRARPNVMYGSPFYSPGGEAIKYVADCRNLVAPCSNPSGGGMYEEDGGDTYRWTSLTNAKNKLYLPGQKIKFRWWIKRNGKTGCGLDPVYDTMEYLDMTKQIVEKGRKGFYIILGHKCKAKKYLDEIMFTVDSFKNLVINGYVDVGSSRIKCNIRRICLEQIKSGLAHKWYKPKVSDKKKEEIIEEDDD